MSLIRFEAPIVVIGDRSIVRLPSEASHALPSRGQVAATGSVGSAPVKTVLEPDGLRGHWMDVSGRAGDIVSVELEPTKLWPEPSVPRDFRIALDHAADTAETWADITPMARWEWVRWINSTRVVSTRERRIEVAIDKLRRGNRRPCCFDLSSCTDPELSKNGKLVDA